MDKYYNIARFLIRVTGEKAEDIQRVCGFEPFEVKPGKPYFTLHLVQQADEEILAEKEEVLLYTIKVENVVGRFDRLADHSYRLIVMSAEADESLLLHYRPGSRECILSGLMKPELLRFSLWTALGMLTAVQAIGIYASVVVFEGKAVIFLGEPSTGKSTHTRLWLEHIPGATLLTDGGPVILRDSSIPYICSSPWSESTYCCHDECFPLAGIVHLSQATHNQMYRLWMFEAIGAILSSCPSVFAKDEELSRHICDTLFEVLNLVPVWQLECLPDEAAVRLSHATIFPRIEDSNYERRMGAEAT